MKRRCADTIILKIIEINSSFHVSYMKSLVSIFQDFFASINGNLGFGMEAGHYSTGSHSTELRHFPYFS